MLPGNNDYNDEIYEWEPQVQTLIANQQGNSVGRKQVSCF